MEWSNTSWIEWLARIHCGLVTPYGDIDLDQHWCSQLHVAERHPAITWTNVDLSPVTSSEIHLRVNWQEIPQPTILNISFKIINITFYCHFSGANALIVVYCVDISMFAICA